MVKISMEDALTRLDLRVPLSKKIRCPAHDEKVPSLHIYKDHYYCYSCGANGDGIGMLAFFTGRSVNDLYREIADAAGPTSFQPTAASSHLSEYKTTQLLLDYFHELTREFWNELRECYAQWAPWWQYDRTVCYWDERFDDLLTLIKDEKLSGFDRKGAIDDLRMSVSYELI